MSSRTSTSRLNSRTASTNLLVSLNLLTIKKSPQFKKIQWTTRRWKCCNDWRKTIPIVSSQSSINPKSTRLRRGKNKLRSSWCCLSLKSKERRKWSGLSHWLLNWLNRNQDKLGRQCWCSHQNRWRNDVFRLTLISQRFSCRARIRSRHRV